MARERQDKPVSSLARLNQALAWLVAASCALIAIFSALIGWHFFRQGRVMRIEIEDLVMEKKALRREMLGEREVLVREIEDMTFAQNQVGALISRLTGAKPPPGSEEELISELARIRGLVQGQPLSAAEKQEMSLTLRNLVSNRGKGGDASAILHRLADQALVDREKIPIMLTVLRGEEAPISTGHKPATPPKNEPRVEAKPARPQASIPVAGKPDPMAATLAEPIPPPEPPPPTPRPQIPEMTKVKQVQGKFEVAFPPDWTIRDKELPSGIMALSPKFQDIPGERAYVVANASDLLHQQILVEFASQQSEQIARGLVNARRITDGDMRMDGHPAKFVFFSHQQAGRSFLSMYLFLISKEKGYILTFSARSDLYPRMEKAFNDIA